MLAILRGVREEVLSMGIEIDTTKALALVQSRVIQERETPFVSYLLAYSEDAYHRLLFPSLQTEVRRALKERADAEAITVFRRSGGESSRGTVWNWTSSSVAFTLPRGSCGTRDSAPSLPPPLHQYAIVPFAFRFQVNWLTQEPPLSSSQLCWGYRCRVTRRTARLAVARVALPSAAPHCATGE